MAGCGVCTVCWGGRGCIGEEGTWMNEEERGGERGVGEGGGGRGGGGGEVGGGGGGGGAVQSNISHIEPEEYASNTIPLEA